jgi:uncharacterized membrane protein
VSNFTITQALRAGFSHTISHFGLFFVVYVVRALMGLVSLVSLLAALHGREMVTLLLRGLTSGAVTALPTPSMPAMEQFHSFDVLTLAVAALTFGIVIIIDSFFVLGLTKIGLDINDTGASTITRLWWASPRMFFNNALLTLIFNILVFAGTLLFIIPGIIIGTILSFSFIYLVDKDATCIQSLKASVAYTKGKRVQLFAFYAILGFINLIGSIPFGLGVIFTGPFSLCAQVWVYRQLTK